MNIIIELVGGKLRIGLGTLTGILFVLGILTICSKGIIIGIFLIFPLYIYYIPVMVYDVRKQTEESLK